MPGTPLTVRRAARRDLDSCVALLQEAYGGRVPWRERLAAVLATGELFLVAVVGDTVVGCGRAGRRAPRDPEDPAPPGWYLTGVVVDASHRRQGVARRLVGDLLPHRPAGEPVWSVTGAGNSASLALHRAAGFNEVLRAPRLLGETFGDGEGVLLRADP